MRVAFYVPSPALVRSAPASTADYWPWIIEAVRAAPAQLGDGRGACTWLGPYNWTIQTCLELKRSGFDCELTATVPDEGVVIAHGTRLAAYGHVLRIGYVIAVPLGLLVGIGIAANSRRSRRTLEAP